MAMFYSPHSQPITSPRKPLGSLSTNLPVSPNKIIPSNDKSPAAHCLLSPIAPPAASLTRGIKRLVPEDSQDASTILHPSKRWESMNDVHSTVLEVPQQHLLSSQEDGKSSFSSFINYGPSSESGDDQVLVTCDGDKQANGERNGPGAAKRVQQDLAVNTVKDRAEQLKARLKLAMYKINTNQIQTPLEGLRIIEPLAPKSSIPSTPIKQCHETPNGASNNVSPQQERKNQSQKNDVDLTSSAVKGHAINGLLELKRSGRNGMA